MGESWTGNERLVRDGASPLDLDAADEAWVELGRKRAAQRELAPSRTPQQWRTNTQSSQPFLTDGELALARIVKLEARIDKLHDLVEQQQTGARHLAGRIDRLDRDAIILGRLFKAFEARVTAKFPSVGKPTIREQCDAAWRAPTKEESGE